MNRRSFLTRAGGITAGGLLTPWAFGRTAIRWQKAASAPFFTQAEWGGIPLVHRGQHGLLTAACSVDPDAAPTPLLGIGMDRANAGGCEALLTHRLIGEEALEAELTVRNRSARPVMVTLEFTSSAHPSYSYGGRRADFPLTAGGLMTHPVLKELGHDQMGDCDQFIGSPGENSSPVICHYREPEESDPAAHTTRGPLLIPLVDSYQPGVGVRLAFFCAPLRAWRVASFGNPRGEGGWSFRARVQIEAGAEIRERCWLYPHEGDSRNAWDAFHRLAYRDELAPLAWPPQVKVHYYDFLGPSSHEAHRGGGYDEDAGHFREFHVGLATQHGYYPFFGDYIHPDRKEWQAMRNDEAGAVPMSFEKMRARCRATRAAGAKAAIYLHTDAFDSASPRAPELRDAILVGPDGKPTLMEYWQGPDVVGALWVMSIAAPAWRRYLLEQARWIMEILKPDAIVIDETFSGFGYDHCPGRRGGMFAHMVRFLTDMRRLVRSYNPEAGVFTSDCSLAGFGLWADGEAGDHAYGALLGNELYRRPPVRYRSVLGRKAWIPCAWQFTRYWDEQMDLARKAGAGVGVSNGWIEYTGLSELPPATHEKILKDIAGLTGSEKRT